MHQWEHGGVQGHSCIPHTGAQRVARRHQGRRGKQGGHQGHRLHMDGVAGWRTCIGGGGGGFLKGGYGGGGGGRRNRILNCFVGDCWSLRRRLK